ncbi:MAG: retroviral-like aspartic protease family protein [Rubrivivax sp.]|nr:retroviral-like aspartic protease family protein [Rubrivivax sp.]
MRRRIAASSLLAAVALLGALPALAQSVALAGRMGDRALLIVDGTPHTVAPRATVAGVKLLRWAGDEAEVQLPGSRVPLRLRVGTPAQIGSARIATAGRDIVMTADAGGHFRPSGSINGKAVRYMVDTGATLVAMGQDEALRLGVDLSQAQQGRVQTANGPVAVRVVVLDRVRVGDVEITQVGAVVMPQPMPFVLLGNSFLSRFQMRRDNDVMRLDLR